MTARSIRLIESNGCFFLASCHGARGGTMAVRATPPAVIGGWTHTTRTSKVFATTWPVDAPQDFDFAGTWHVVAIGPCVPALLQSTSAPAYLWVGLGARNLIACYGNEDDATLAVDALTKRAGVSAERWVIVDGRIEQHASIHAPETVFTHPTLQALAGRPLTPEIDDCAQEIEEFIFLFASLYSRSKSLDGTHAVRLEALPGAVSALLDAAAQKVLSEGQVRAHLTTINAALARHSSQRFSGSSPITGTECHYWTHSFFGTSIANEALDQLGDWLDRFVRGANLPHRLAQLLGKKSDGPKSGHVDPVYWDSFQITKLADLPNLEPGLAANAASAVLGALYDPLLDAPTPLITFFSGRDGFSSNLHSLSVPLTTIAGIGSARWTWATLTHEVCHAIVQGVLAVIYPATTSSDQPQLLGYDIDHAMALERLPSAEPASCLLDEVRRLLIQCTTSMQYMDDQINIGISARERDYTNRDELERTLRKWRPEVEELVVHAMDFLYFYNSGVDRYVKGIWRSWSVIPDIDSRVAEYLLRTACAIYASHFRTGNYDGVRSDLKRNLRALIQESASDVPALVRALELVETDVHWDTIRKQIVARARLVHLVVGYLYDAQIGEPLVIDNVQAGADTPMEDGDEPLGYDAMNVGEFFERTIDHPLNFVRRFSSGWSAYGSMSCWMLYALAFNIRSSP